MLAIKVNESNNISFQLDKYHKCTDNNLVYDHLMEVIYQLMGQHRPHKTKWREGHYRGKVEG